MPVKRFSKKIVGEIDSSLIIGIRAGSNEHRIIGVWAVVVEGRVFIRSWSRKPGGWHRAIVEDPRGLMTIGERKFRVRAVQTRSERLKDAVSAAYAAKYKTPSARKYVKDLNGAKSRATTTELTPSSGP
jgi:hypothetical protein